MTDTLNDRVLALAKAGMSRPQIANAMDISETDVQAILVDTDSLDARVLVFAAAGLDPIQITNLLRPATSVEAVEAIIQNLDNTFPSPGGGSVNSVTAADGSLTVAGTGTDPTLKVTPGTFDASGAAASAQGASLQKSANLTDVANAASARTALGLGSAATHPATDFDAAGTGAAAAATETTRAEAAEALLIPLAQKAAADGVATLDGAGKLPASQLTVDALEYKGTWNANTNSPALSNGTGSPGDFYIVSTGGSAGPVTALAGDYVILNPSLVWEDIPVGAAGKVASFNTRTGPVTLSKADVTGTGLAASDVGADASGAAAAVKGLPLALTGATAPTRFVGGTASGAPSSGTFAVGDFVIDQSGKVWVCTTAGSPGTWTLPSGGSGGPPTGPAGGKLSGTYPNPGLNATAADVGADASGAAAAAQAASLQKTSNLSDLANAGTARTNLGLGSAATHASTDFDAAGTSATETTRAEAAEALLAPLASPALTGNPTVPTQTALTNNTRAASTAYADAAVAVETSRAQAAEAKVNGVAADAVTTKGDLLVSNATPALKRLPVGSDGQVLTADSTQADGVKWAASGTGGGLTATNTINVKSSPYSAKGDGKTVADASITSGQNTLHSTSAAFVSGDSGKSVIIAGAGSAGADLVTTISSVAAGVATLAVNASTTVSSAVATYGTDDTAAIQSAINALAAATPAGGQLQFPEGIYCVVGGLVATYASQITIPDGGSTRLKLELVGARNVGFYDDPTLMSGGSVIQSFLLGQSHASADLSYVPAIIGAQPGAIRNTVVSTRNLVFRCPRNPSIAGLNGGALASLQVGEAKFDTNQTYSSGGFGSVTQPTNPTGIGLIMPQVNNNGMSFARNVSIVAGWYCGFAPGEHADWDDVALVANKIAIGFAAGSGNGGAHTVRGGYTSVEWCAYALAGIDCSSGVVSLGSGLVANVTIQNLDIEDSNSGGGHGQAWMDPVDHLLDANNRFFGTVRYSHSVAGPGTPAGPWTTSGGFALIADYINEYVHVVGAAGEPAFQNSWVNNGGAQGSARFYMNNGRVYLAGGVKSGTTGTSVFTLPAGYRPSALVIAEVASGSATFNFTNQVIVGTDGTVVPQLNNGSAFLALDNISFRIGI